MINLRCRNSNPGRRTFLIAGLALACLMAACNSSKTAVSDTDATEPPRTDVKKGIQPVADDQVAVIETDYGKIVIELYPNVAPKMVERFKKLIQEGFYDGTRFHRVNAGTGLIQGGDPLSRDNDPDNDGAGDSPYPNVPGEFSDVPFDRGTLGAARRGASPAFAGNPALTEDQARGTANCQFFITMEAQPQYDENYTVFGRVTEGINNAEIIMRAPVEEGTERPADPIIIRKITLQPRAK